MVVGMRRTTRVFGVVKSGDGARILRSGRKLYSDHLDVVGKSKKSNSGKVEWLKLLDEDDQNKDVTGWTSGHIGVRRAEAQPEVRNEACDSVAGHEKVRVKNIVKVYERKRKRFEGDVDGPDSYGKGCVGRRMFVNHFVRRAQMRKAGDTGLMCQSSLIVRCTSHVTLGWLARFLNSLLGYLMRHDVKLSKLHGFLCSNPIGTIFESQGLQFLQKCSGTDVPGYCQIYGVTQFAPLFSVDFSAVPACFMYVHSSMFLRSEKMVISFLVNIRSKTVDETLDDNDINETIFCTASGDHISGNNFRSTVDNGIHKKSMVHSAPQGRQVGCHQMNLRSGFSSSKIRGKRSESRCRRRSGIPVGDSFVYSKICVPKSDSIKTDDNVILFESLEAELSRKRLHEGHLTVLTEQLKDSPLGWSSSGLLSPSASNKQARKEDSGECLRNDGEAKVDTTCTREVPYVTSCAANILVIDHDKCHRVKGASVMLEPSVSGRWSIVVKKDDFTKYSHVAETVMKPCTFNRATLDIIWVVNSECKLEFPTREDWSIFKELYKVCSSNNLTAPSDKTIPVPGVRIVSNYENTVTAPYSRPDAYIILDGSEVSRVLAKTSASYDIDSEDEEWLANYNEEMHRRNECHKFISSDALELMIDAIEKALYFSPGDYLDGRFIADVCPELVNEEVVEVVYGYWSKKRKQKSPTLVRVLQAYKPKQVLEAKGPVLRKKRSFKRYASQNGRGKARFLLEGEQLALMNAEEAKDPAATTYVKRATYLRKRAQLLMEKADMATYKATIAVKIAQAAKDAFAPGTAASMFLM